MTANFQFRNRDARTTEDAPLFSAVAQSPKRAATRGLMRSLAHDRLGFLALDADESEIGYYEMGPDMKIEPKDDPQAAAKVRETAQPPGRYTIDAASILVVEDGKRYRLPRGGDHRSPSPPASPSTLAEHLPTSLTRGATVTASAAHGDYAAKFAIDGATDDDSRWIAPEGGERWIELDLGEPRGDPLPRSRHRLEARGPVRRQELRPPAPGRWRVEDAPRRRHPGEQPD